MWHCAVCVSYDQDLTAAAMHGCAGDLDAATACIFLRHVFSCCRDLAAAAAAGGIIVPLDSNNGAVAHAVVHGNPCNHIKTEY